MMTMSVLLVLCSMAILPLVFGVSNYVHYPNAKIHYKFHSFGKKFYDANLTCHSEGAVMATPKSQLEADILRDIFATRTLTGVSNGDVLFLGFHDMYLEGSYKDVQEHPIQYFYQRWLNGQPNGGTGENCIIMNRQGMYEDWTCEHNLAFVCQKGGNAEIPPVNNERCPTGDPGYEYDAASKRCYKIHAVPMAWSDARAICRAEGGHLAVPRNERDEAFAMRLIERHQSAGVHQDLRPYAFIGLTDYFEEGHWATEFNEPLDDIKYVNWKAGAPNGGGGENCAAIWMGGGMDDANCRSLAMFLCQMQPTDPFDLRSNMDKSTNQ